MERLVAVVIIPSSLLWAAAQVRAFGQVLAAVSGIDPTTAITLAAVVVVLYTMTGGLMADSVSDVVQGAVLVAGLVALAAAIALAGDGDALSRLPADRWSILPPDQPWLAHVERWAIPIVGSLVAQEVIARALAARSPGIARGATIAGGALYLGIGFLPILAGMAGFALLPGLADPDQVLILQAERYLPTAILVVFAGALVSAILSTVDSTLLVAGSFAGHNLILSFRPDVSPRTRLRVNRGAVVVFGLVAYGLALSAESVFDLVWESSAFGTAGIVVLYLFAFRRGWGGAWAAAGAVVAGSIVYQAGSRAEALAYPYLTALGAALAAYLAIGALERAGDPGARWRATRRPKAPRP